MNRFQRQPVSCRPVPSRRRRLVRGNLLETGVFRYGSLFHRLPNGFTIAETVCAGAGLALLATSAGSLLTLASRNHASAAARIRALRETDAVMESFRITVGNAHRVVVASPPALSCDSGRLVLERSPTPSVPNPARISLTVDNGRLLRTGGPSGNTRTILSASVESIVFRYGFPDSSGNLVFADIKAIPADRISAIAAVEVDATVRQGAARVREVATFRLRPTASIAGGTAVPHRSVIHNRERKT